MSKDGHTVIFEPGDIAVPLVPEGQTLQRVALDARIDVASPCGGAGACGRCKVEVLSGRVEAERSVHLSAEEWEAGVRLACRCVVRGDAEVRVPPGSRVEGSGPLQHTLAGDQPGTTLAARDPVPPLAPGELTPVGHKVTLELPPPSERDNLNDLARFKRALRNQYGLTGVSVDSIWVRNMPAVLREENWLVTATLVETPYGHKVINIEPGAQSEESFCVALDIGTTTVWGELLDMNSGEVLAQSSSYNRQIRFGEDVISRIIYASDVESREHLQNAVVETINIIIDDMVAAAGIVRSKIAHIQAAGNTAMTCFVLGIDPRYLRLAPYVPPVDFVAPVRAVNLGDGVRVGRHCHMYCFPAVASYVGGDIVAGIAGSGVSTTEMITLYIDVGTNGEVVIGNREWLIAASCSAGPAFEGGGIACGVRATAGAVESVRVDPVSHAPSVAVIGDRPALGICGSGIIDAVAELLRTGVIGQDGRFRHEAGGHVRMNEGRPEYVLVPSAYTANGADIIVSESDIENVMRAKASIFAGIQTLLDSVTLEWGDLEQIVIAGGFGRSLRIEQAQIIGLFPEVDRDKFIFIGNGSLLGARRASFSKNVLKSAHQVAQMMTNIELSDNQSFYDNYMAALFLPHTDLRLFPRMQSLLATVGKDGEEQA